MRPSRRLLVGKLLPVGLMALFLGGAAWLLISSSERNQALRAEEARTTLASFAKSAAIRDLPQEIGKRFDVLTKEAADPKLIELVSGLNVDPGNEQLFKQLKEWIVHLPDRYEQEMSVDSWFVQNVNGVQVARSPQDPDSFRKDYWYRDYFHGEGQDLDKEDLQLKAAAKPIQHKHLSAVYPSSTSHLLKVAFSVPIRKETPGPAGGKGTSEVIGVLAMSMNVNDFTVLDKTLAGGNEVVLIDLRNDSVEGVPKRGLILHHPRLEKDKPSRVTPDFLARIDEAQPLTRPNFDGRDFFQSGYRDPIAGEKGPKYWGVFEPVRYRIGNREEEGASDRFGWLVLVQKPIER
jgi:hypothetical protein